MVIRMTMFSTTPFERFILASRKPFSPYISDHNFSVSFAGLSQPHIKYHVTSRQKPQSLPVFTTTSQWCHLRTWLQLLSHKPMTCMHTYIFGLISNCLLISSEMIQHIHSRFNMFTINPHASIKSYLKQTEEPVLFHCSLPRRIAAVFILPHKPGSETANSPS